MTLDAGAAGDERRAVAQLHLILGPVGAGKSTYARTLCAEHRAVALILDDWMARLFGADIRPETGRVAWYLERRDRVFEQIWQLTRQLVAVDTCVVLEVGLIRRMEREAFYRRVEDAGLGLTIHLLDADREVRRERVLRRNQEKDVVQVVPLEFFEMASDLWEPPDDIELSARDVRVR